jgi:hypothetical protein
LHTTESAVFVDDIVFTDPLLRNEFYNFVVPPLLGANGIENSLIYFCVLNRVYRDVAWQRVDQIRYNIPAET